ncbi:MAG: hypothetical protein AB2807_08070, partial [Candidatus Sedimenticola endophacoides]
MAPARVRPKRGEKGGRPFDIRSLAKSDVDQVTELQLQFAMETLKVLTHKLYMRNPKEWRKAGLDDPEAAVARVFGPGRTGIYPELRGLRQECRYLVKDFGTSQSPKSTRQRDSRYCPD